MGGGEFKNSLENNGGVKIRTPQSVYSGAIWMSKWIK